MSQSQGNNSGAVEKAMGTVTPSYFGRPDMEMDSIGWVIFLALLVLLAPVLPFFLVGWMVMKGLDFVGNDVVGE